MAVECHTAAMVHWLFGLELGAHRAQVAPTVGSPVPSNAVAPEPTSPPLSSTEPVVPLEIREAMAAMARARGLARPTDFDEPARPFDVDHVATAVDSRGSPWAKPSRPGSHGADGHRQVVASGLFRFPVVIPRIPGHHRTAARARPDPLEEES